MFKNVASQKFYVFAFDATTNLPKTGDAANLTAYVAKDWGSATVLGDTSATEVDATNAPGYYMFDATQAETNGDVLLVSGKSSTANIKVLGAPAVIFTRPPSFTSFVTPTGAVPGDSSGITTLLTRLSSTRAGYLDNLSAGAVALASSILDAAGIRTALGLASANLDTQLSTMAGYMDTEIAAIKAKTDNLPSDPADASDIAAALAALDDLSASQVNAEVVDALNVDTYAEASGVPGYPATLAGMIRHSYAALLNPVDVTASKKTFKSAGGSGKWSKTLADDGTTYSETGAGAP